METEAELKKDAAQHTDAGYSEDKLARRFDKGAPANATVIGGNVFAPVKKVTQQTVFQAQKKEEV